MRVNLDSAFRLLRAGLPALRAAGGGSFVTIGSALGHAADRDFLTAAYAASKAALAGARARRRARGRAVGRAREQRRRRPRHDADVRAGCRRTSASWRRLGELQPLGGRMLDPAAIAGAVAWLLSPAVGGHDRRDAARGRRLEPAVSVAVRYAPADVAAVPELWSGDVLVVGGGSAGAAAATAAAREGARTLLVEAAGFLGGTGAAVLDTFYGFYAPGGDARVVGGIGWELCERLLGSGQAFERPNTYGAGTGRDLRARGAQVRVGRDRRRRRAPASCTTRA